MGRILRDPLTLFVLLGALVFVVDAILRDEPADRHIVVDASTVTRIRDQWQAQAGRPPSVEELEGLVDDFVQEEILYREAMRMGLDRDDVIVRRRLAQKLEFLSEDLAVPDEPEEAALRDYYERHRERYALPDRISLSHVYVSAERAGGTGAARSEAATLQPQLEEATGDRWRDIGDPFILARSYAERSPGEIRDLFGGSFADAVAALPVGTGWQGPIESAYGAHLVRIEARSPARALAFDEVAARVRDDYLVDHRKSANDAFYRSLKERYTVERAVAP